MKKQFIIALFALIACGTRAYAQSSLMATLSHENEISTFYGANALQEAHAASAHGDVITLSSGSFAGVDITKAVTIRGAGMEVDTVNNIEPTIISTDFSIEIPDSVGKSLTIEGIYTNRDITVKNLSNAKFLKSRFGYIDYANANASVMKDLDFINCRIAKNISVSNNSSALFQNSIVQNVTTAGITTYFLSFNNCIIRGGGSMDNSEYKNNIIINCGNGNNQSTYYNNLFIGNYDNINSSNTTNVIVKPDDERVTELTGDYSDSKTYKLNDALKSLIKGTDGTEVGIYGGNMPYDATPTNPQITKFNVSQKTTADGKLSVDIEVNGGGQQIQ